MAAPTLDDLAALRLSRRDILKISSATGLSALFSSSLIGCTIFSPLRRVANFTSVPISSSDTVVVPPGYTSREFFAWGDPISDGPLFKPDASNSADEQALQAGMHHDGMQFFSLPLDSKNPHHGLLVINHEYLDQQLLFPDGMKSWDAEKLRKAQHGVGVSIIEVKRSGGRGGEWQVVRPSKFARRVTALTPMSVGGPARGSPLMRTAADPLGVEVFGTHSNCANGFTPWGTYLTCEENFHNHFSLPSGTQSPKQKRYGLRTRSPYRWHEFDERFDADKHPNEFNRFGWIVEIDPFDPQSRPVKRTALGRCAHESAFHTLAPDGHVVVYTGDDTHFEYIFKFVSRDAYHPGNRAANRDLLDHGTLYVANFSAEGSGAWIPLVHGQSGLTVENGFADQADVVIHAKQAGEQAGGTRMDRPEWIVIHPKTGEVYASLTNNSQRGTEGKPVADAPNPRNRNLYGQIIRWRETGGNAAADSFKWDLFVIAGDPEHAESEHRGNIKGDTFACPDCLTFAPDGTLWIGTDFAATGRGAYENLGNNQLLAASTDSGEIRRFLTGPRGCEITGLTFTPDGKTAFLNIQHPGGASAESEGPRASTWPSKVEGARPRSATIVITKDDGGFIGS